MDPFSSTPQVGERAETRESKRLQGCLFLILYGEEPEEARNFQDLFVKSVRKKETGPLTSQVLSFFAQRSKQGLPAYSFLR
jgi:hypothetical protein